MCILEFHPSNRPNYWDQETDEGQEGSCYQSDGKVRPNKSAVWWMSSTFLDDSWCCVMNKPVSKCTRVCLCVSKAGSTKRMPGLVVFNTCLYMHASTWNRCDIASLSCEYKNNSRSGHQKCLPNCKLLAKILNFHIL